MNKPFEQQYRELVQEILEHGSKVFNQRTNSNVLTVLDKTFTYTEDDFPILTSRYINWKGAIAELLGYLKGYTNSDDFKELGTNTWEANANNPEWTNSSQYLHKNDMGLVYGGVSRICPIFNRDYKYIGSKDLLLNLCKKLYAHNDDRGLILSFWNESLQHLGCLRPCMYEHQFSILDNTLYLHSTQRSADIPLGTCFNAIQCYTLLKLMCEFTGLKFGYVKHRMINCHIYENQVKSMKLLLKREPIENTSKLTVYLPNFNSAENFVEYIDNNLSLDEFDIPNYTHLGSIKIPFTV